MTVDLTMLKYMIEAFVFNLPFIEKKYLLNMLILVLNIRPVSDHILKFMFTVLMRKHGIL